MPTDDRPWRCFVAVPIGAELREALAAYARRLQSLPALERGWRWTDADGWHVTLAFIGATPPSRVPDLGARLASVGDAAEPFALASNGLGTFPGRGPARVLWYGFDDRNGRLRRLARAVQDAVGIERDARFRPHLTLARARERFGVEVGALPADPPPPTGRLVVDQVILYRSHLGRGPAGYEALATSPLAGSARAAG